MGAKTKGEYLPPVVPAELKGMSNASVGWVGEDAIARHGHPPSTDTRYTHIPCIQYAYNIIMCIFIYNILYQLCAYVSCIYKTFRVIVCGLPGIYDKLCGPRSSPVLSEGSALYRLGFTSEMVIKL